MVDARADFLEGSPTAAQDDGRGAPRSAVAGLLNVENILLHVDAVTPNGVFSRIATSIGLRHGLRAQAVVAGLTEREKLGSTALGQGVAIPHARLAGLERAIAVFVRLRAAIAFAAPDGKPVSSLFVLLVPENATDAHLELLAQVAGMFSARAFRDRLNACVTAPEILATLTGWRSTRGACKAMTPAYPSFCPQAVAVDLDVQGNIALLRVAAEMLTRFCRIEAAPIFRALHRREQAGSTAVGDGLAIPHARIPGIDAPVTLYLRTRTALRFGAPDGKPVSEFFVIVVPAGGAPETQLGLLREVAERFSQPAFRGMLATASSTAAVAAVFARWGEARYDPSDTLQRVS